MYDKVAILGGSFDPVHLGHLFLLHSAVKLTDYNHFILVPAKLSNFKQNARPVATDSQRLKMLELALEDYKSLYPNDRKVKIEISDTELKRGGISYTSDTVLEFVEKMGMEKLGLIIGDDHIKSLSDWHDFDLFKNKVQFLICSRYNKEGQWDNLPKDIDYIKLELDKTSPEDSTSIRNNVSKYSDYLSKGVACYVRENNLYN